jgi:hypothetical protein
MSYNLHQYNLNNFLGKPLGLPLNIPQVPLLAPAPKTRAKENMDPSDVPGSKLPRAINYLADYGGCALWRCLGPNFVINLYEKGVVHELTQMILDERFYQGIKAVKLQRQATPAQLQFAKGLKKLSQQCGFKLIYEVDDVVLGEDIPLYNKNRGAFTSPEIRNSIIEIMQLCDEITVPSEYMRDYYIAKTGNKNISHIPNYLFRWWWDRYYNLNERVKLYEKNKKKPVIAIFASGTHVDVAGRTNFVDDFTPVVKNIIATRKMFKWVFYGSFPFQVKPFIDAGEMEFRPWSKLPDYSRTIAESGAQLTFAALLDNEFNKSKSNIKLTEAGAIGIPCICPDMVTYQDAFLKYKTGDEFIDCIQYALKNQSRYADLCKKSRALAETYWLEDDKNINKFVEAYFTPYKSSVRKFLI